MLAHEQSYLLMDGTDLARNRSLKQLLKPINTKPERHMPKIIATPILTHSTSLFRRHRGEARDGFGDAAWALRFADQSTTGLGDQVRGVAGDCHEDGFRRRHVVLSFRRYRDTEQGMSLEMYQEDVGKRQNGFHRAQRLAWQKTYVGQSQVFGLLLQTAPVHASAHKHELDAGKGLPAQGGSLKD